MSRFYPAETTSKSGRPGTPPTSPGRYPRCRDAHQGEYRDVTSTPYEHLGEALGTDFFSVQEQFAAEQWERFVTTRRFVDEEVLPVIGPYWERAELP